jgi:hypothetical protein
MRASGATDHHPDLRRYISWYPEFAIFTNSTWEDKSDGAKLQGVVMGGKMGANGRIELGDTGTRTSPDSIIQWITDTINNNNLYKVRTVRSGLLTTVSTRNNSSNVRGLGAARGRPISKSSRYTRGNTNGRNEGDTIAERKLKFSMRGRRNRGTGSSRIVKTDSDNANTLNNNSSQRYISRRNGSQRGIRGIRELEVAPRKDVYTIEKDGKVYIVSKGGSNSDNTSNSSNVVQSSHGNLNKLTTDTSNVGQQNPSTNTSSLQFSRRDHRRR